MVENDGELFGRSYGRSMVDSVGGGEDGDGISGHGELCIV